MLNLATSAIGLPLIGATQLYIGKMPCYEASPLLLPFPSILRLRRTGLASCNTLSCLLHYTEHPSLKSLRLTRVLVRILRRRGGEGGQGEGNGCLEMYGWESSVRE